MVTTPSREGGRDGREVREEAEGEGEDGGGAGLPLDCALLQALFVSPFVSVLLGLLLCFCFSKMG